MAKFKTKKSKLDPNFARSYHTDIFQIRSVVGICTCHLTPVSPFTLTAVSYPKSKLRGS